MGKHTVIIIRHFTTKLVSKSKQVSLFGWGQSKGSGCPVLEPESCLAEMSKWNPQQSWPESCWDSFKATHSVMGVWAQLSLWLTQKPPLTRGRGSDFGAQIGVNTDLATATNIGLKFPWQSQNLDQTFLILISFPNFFPSVKMKYMSSLHTSNEF